MKNKIYSEIFFGEAALESFLKVSKSDLEELVAQKKLKAIKKSGKIYATENALYEYIFPLISTYSD